MGHTCIFLCELNPLNLGMVGKEVSKPSFDVMVMPSPPFREQERTDRQAYHLDIRKIHPAVKPLVPVPFIRSLLTRTRRKLMIST